jgi:hypothetical protein
MQRRRSKGLNPTTSLVITNLIHHFRVSPQFDTGLGQQVHCPSFALYGDASVLLSMLITSFYTSPHPHEPECTQDFVPLPALDKIICYSISC